MDQPTINGPAPAGGSSTFEMPPDVTPSEPMGGKTSPAMKGGSVPSTAQEPKKPIGSYIVIIILVIVLIIGSLLFAAWKGWIKLDGLFGSATPTPSPSVSSKISPAISPMTSPEITSSPQITSNVNDETRKKDLANIKAALKKYYLDKSEYPQSQTGIKTSDKSSVLAQALGPTYLESLPDDPQAPQYYYGYKSDGQIFELTCVLEDKSDASGTITGLYNIYKITNSSVE